jgi:ketosteroid isomerase-like protein
MTTETSKATDEAEIRGLIKAWAAAIRAKDANAVVSHTSPESVGFFLAPPLKADAPLKKSLEDWFQTFRGPIGYEIRDLKITFGGDVAFCHSPDGRWLVTHEHESVPFYMDGSNRAAVDLKP